MIPEEAISTARQIVAMTVQRLIDMKECPTDALLLLSISYAHAANILNKHAQDDESKNTVRCKTKAGIASILMMLKANGIDINVPPIDLSDIGETQMFALYHDGESVHSIN